jgi:hypothetical protein
MNLKISMAESREETQQAEQNINENSQTESGHPTKLNKKIQACPVIRIT